MKRRIFVSIALAASSSLGWTQTSYPTRPVKMIVPFPAGGSPDLIARFLGEKLGQPFGQPVVVENRAGASGGLGLQSVANSPADGYSLLMGSTGPLTANPAVMPNIGYNPLTDLVPVVLVGRSPLVLMVNPGVQAKDLKELLELARRNPDLFSYASAGTGNLTHLVAEMMKIRSGAKILHVPYKGTAGVKTDVLAGRVSMFFDTVPAALPLIRAGQVRAMAVTSRERTASAPDIPTFAELGLGADFDVSGWFAVLGPRGLPQEVVDRVNQDINKVLQTPEAQERFKGWGIEILGGPPSSLAGLMTSEIARWKEVVRVASIKPE